MRAGSLGGVEGGRVRVCHERERGITPGRLAGRVVVPVMELVNRQRVHTRSIAVESCRALGGPQSRPIL